MTVAGAEMAVCFFCKGEKFSARYAEEAQKKGAVAIIYPAGIGFDAEKLISALPVTVVKVRNISRTMAIAAARFYGDPMSKMKSIAVTGTKGKTYGGALHKFGTR